MDHETFEKIFETTVDTSREVLLNKAREYATDSDRLHNFKKGANLIGGTPEQALWGFLTKHLVSLSDMVYSPKQYTAAQWEEKIGDSINYLILLKAQVTETEFNRIWDKERGIGN